MSLPPIFSAKSRILILGSYPSPKSREVQFYYGNERNRFWHVLCACLGKEMPAPADNAAKKELILAANLALWDTLASCTIKGASDASITHAVPNDLAYIFTSAPIERIICNGATAYKMYQKYNNMYNIQCIPLPSTSPANASYSCEKLIGLWLPALSL